MNKMDVERLIFWNNYGQLGMDHKHKLFLVFSFSLLLFQISF